MGPRQRLDPDGDGLEAILVSGPAHGALTLSGDGSLGYVHDGSETTGDGFTYQARDGLGRIAFQSTRNGDNEIYVMNPDGSGQTRLTSGPGDYRPEWSPDGRKIASKSLRDGDWEIYVVNADGTNETRLTDNLEEDQMHNWSPDSSRIIFWSVMDYPNDTGPGELYVINADGSDQIRLTDNFANDNSPEWSPDGTKIVFVSDRDLLAGIYVMNADGTGQINLTPNAAQNFAPAWSPEGNRIAFGSNRDGNSKIYLMNADGTGQTRLTSNLAQDDGLAWSPDGSKIAYVSRIDGNREIYVMNSDGTGNTNLTNDPAPDEGPDWSPDGRKIAFFSHREGHYVVYVVNADGTAQTNLTTEAENWWPDWSPGPVGPPAVSNIAAVSINVSPVNDAPVALGDAYTVDQGGTLIIGAPGVLANDSDAEGDPLTAALVSGVPNGSLTLNTDGAFLYVHDGSATTEDSFTYVASDGPSQSNEAIVTITVTPAA